MSKKEKKGINADRVREAWEWAYPLRNILLALPVVGIAILQAIINIAKLPSQVGLDMMASGEFQFFVGKGIAVLGPLVLTCLCLVLMFWSKRVLYPWLVSVFSLALPIVLWLTNVFPG